MEIVIKVPCHIHGVPRKEGDVVLVSSAEARQFISSGHAVEFKVEKAPKKTKKVESLVTRQMALEFDNDFNGYFDSDYGHGVACTYTPDGGSAVSIKVILDQEYLEVDGATVGINSNQPIVYGKAKDLRNAAYGDQLDFAAITDLDDNVIKAAASYKITSVQPDNHGIIALALTEMTTVVTLNGEDINVTDLSEQFIEVE